MTPAPPPQALDVVRFQPHPAHVQVSHMPAGGGVITAIARSWARGDAARCRLCPQCRATMDRCLVQVRTFVGEESAALYSLLGCAGVRREDRAAL